MRIRQYYGLTQSLLTAAVLLFSASVVASPQGWSEGGMKPGHAHGKNHGAGGNWKDKMGGGFAMGGEGFMTARLRAVWTLDLSQDQKTKIRAIQRDLRSKHWALEDKIELTADKLFDLYKTDKRDAKAIGKVYGEIFDYRRQIIELAIEAGNGVESVLTKQQLMSLKKWRPQPKWGGGWGGK